MADRHKSRPKAVRMPDGLLAWYQHRAGETGQSVNALLVAALEDYRQRHDSGSTTTPKTPASPVSAALPKAPPAARQRCTHPGTRVIGGWCKTCEHMIEPGGLWR